MTRPVALDEATQLVDAAELARRLGVTRQTVYAHAAELGGIRIGTGPKARYRFDPTIASQALAPSEPIVEPSGRPANGHSARPTPNAGSILAIRPAPRP